MKKLLMAAVALFCMTMTCVVLTACGSDDEDTAKTYNYTLNFEVKYFSWESTLEEDNSESALKEWKNSILNAYKSALGVSSETFSLNGTQSECDKKVQTACKKAEATVATIKGGTGIVTVKNNTANNTVYTYNVQE